MKKLLWLLVFTVFAVGFVHAVQEDACVTIRGCVDGSDWVTIDNGALTLAHDQYNPIGQDGSCSDSYKNVIYIDDVSYPLTYSGGYFIDSLGSFPVNLKGIESFDKITGRGDVTLTDNTIYIDDNAQSAADVYTIELCGEPVENDVPEFGTIAAIVAIVGAAVAVIVIRKRK